MDTGRAGEELPEEPGNGKSTDELRRERQRIARLLHDTVCQEMTGISLLVHAMANRQRPASPELARQLVEIAEMIQRTGETTQEIMRGLGHGT